MECLPDVLQQVSQQQLSSVCTCLVVGVALEVEESLFLAQHLTVFYGTQSCLLNTRM